MENQNEKLIKYSFQFNNSIRVFISLYKFKQELSKKKSEILSKEVYLLNKNWFNTYKDFYLFDRIYDLIKSNNLTDLDLTEQQLIFNNLFKEFYNKNSEKSLLLLFYDEEFPDIILYDHDINVKYVNDFEIINKEVYEDLLNCMGVFKYCNRNAKFYRFKILEKKIIIKYNNESQKCLNLLIGNIGTKTDIFSPELLINFNDMNLLKNEYKSFTKENLEQYINETFDKNKIESITQDSISQSFYKKDVKFFIYLHNNYPSLTEIKDDIQKTNKIEKENIVRVFIYYYLNNQRFIENNKNEIIKEEEKKSFCYLINKTWMDKFKEFFNYQELKELLIDKINKKYSNYLNDIGHNSILKNDKAILDLFMYIKQNDVFMNNLGKLNEKHLIDNLCFLNPFLIEFDYDEMIKKEKNLYLKIYKNFEIIPYNEYNFIRSLFPLAESNCEKQKYFIKDENYLSFSSENKQNKILNIYSIKKTNEEVSFNIECLIKGIGFKEFSKNIKNKTLKKYILSFNFEDNLFSQLDNSDGFVYLLKEGELFKNLEKMNAIKNLIFKLAKFIDRVNSKEQNSENKNCKVKFIYLVHKEFVINYLEKFNLNYSTINKEFLNKKKKNGENISLSKKEELLNNFINNNIKFPLENIDKNDKVNISNKNLENNINELHNCIINNNNEQIIYYDNYFLLNEKILDSMNVGLKQCYKLEYIIKEKNIFLFGTIGGRTIIEICKLDEENTFKLEILIDLTGNYKLVINLLKNKTYEQFLSSFFIFTPENNEFSNFSPFFDEQSNIIGNAYKIKKGLNNFSNCNYNQMFINIIYLIRYFKFFNYFHKKPELNKGFYLVSEDWIKDFKKKLLYEETKEEIETNKNKEISNLINKEQATTKSIYELVSQMPQRNKFFNSIVQLNIEHVIEPNLGSMNDYLSGNDFFFYNDFYLLDEEIHSRLLNLNKQQSKEMKSKNYFCNCYFNDGFIFITLNKYITNLDKYVIEVGKLDENMKFNLNYIIVFNTKNDLDYNMQMMEQIAKSIGGIKNYFKSYLDFNDKNIVTLHSNNSELECGYIYKYSENMNTNQIIKNNDDEFNNKNNMSINLNINNNSIDIPQDPINLPQLTEFFHNPPMIGLQNVGATCYMNATLQCFGQISKFV